MDGHKADLFKHIFLKDPSRFKEDIFPFLAETIHTNNIELFEWILESTEDVYVGESNRMVLINKIDKLENKNVWFSIFNKV